MYLTRRSFILTPAVALVVPARGQVIQFLGDLIVELFEKVVGIGISLLLDSAAKYIWAHYIAPKGSSPGGVRYASLAEPYVEGGRAADNFCPWCTIEYARKGETFWNGALFQPNEENTFYRGFNQPTDQVLLQALSGSESLHYLDVGKNPAAHFSTALLEEVRGRVMRLEADKARLYYEMDHKTFAPATLDSYVIPRSVLNEIDRQYEHVNRIWHKDQKYVDAVLELQKFTTWYNAKLLAVGSAVKTNELLA